METFEEKRMQSEDRKENMRYQKQTEFNNCFATCVANILDIDIADVPNLCHMTASDFWAIPAQRWLMDQGWFMIELEWGKISAPIPEDYPVIINGLTARGKRHSVIGFIRSTVDGKSMSVDYHFDPHKDDTFLETVEWVTLLIRRKFYA